MSEQTAVLVLSTTLFSIPLIALTAVAMHLRYISMAKAANALLGLVLSGTAIYCIYVLVA